MEGLIPKDKSYSVKTLGSKDKTISDSEIENKKISAF